MGAVYTQLSLRERRRIEDWWHAKVPVTEVVRVLQSTTATLSLGMEKPLGLRTKSRLTEEPERSQTATGPNGL